MSSPILVTGASGQVGGHVLRALVAGGTAVRALYRDPGKAEQARGPLVEPVVADFADTGAMTRALAGVRRLLLVSAPAADQDDLEAAVLQAARRTGVEYVVKSSILGADPSSVPFRAAQGRAEEALRASGLRHAVLRPHYFTQNLLNSAELVRTKGVYEDSTGGAAISMVDLRDLGEAAAALLTGPERDGEVFDLTGPEALTGADLAAAFSEVTGEQVRAVDLPPAEFGARLAGWGVPRWNADGLVTLYQDYAASGATGYAARVTDAVSELTGRPARSVRAFLTENAELFRAGRG